MDLGLPIEVCSMLSLPLVSVAQPAVADNHWPLDEMLPVQQDGLQKGVCHELHVVSRRLQVYYGVDRWLAIKLPQCYINELIDAKREQARARLGGQR